MLNDLPTVRVYTAAPGQTLFNYPFRPFSLDYIVVTVDGVTFSRTAPGGGVGTWSSLNDPAVEGGSFTLGAACVGGEQVVVRRQLVRERISNFPAVGPVTNPTLDRQFDYQLAILQEISDLGDDLVSRALIVPIGEVGALLPAAALRANKYVSFLPDGSVLMSAGTGADLGLRGDLGGNSGSAMLTFKRAATTGSVGRSAEDKLGEFASFADVAAPITGANATAMINNVLASSRHVESGTGNYHALGIVMANPGQVLKSRGNTNIMRLGNGAIINSATSDLTIENISFYGQSPTYSGDLLVFTGDRGKLINCAARAVGASKGLKITGSSWTLRGTNDVYQGDIEFASNGIGGVSQYHVISELRLTGNLTFTDTAMITLSHSLIAGNVTIDKGIGTAGGHGARLTTSRIVGTLTVKQSSTSIGSGMSISGNVVVGDGVNAYDGITFDDSFVQASGFSFTINALVKGTFHLSHVVTAGIIPTIPASVRQTSNIYHGAIPYTPTISGGAGSWVPGSSTVTAEFSQQGNVINGQITLSVGAGATFPTSGLFATVPVNTGGRPINCKIEVFKSGVGSYSLEGRIFSDGLRILGWRQKDAAIDDLFTHLAPATLAAGDVVTWVFSYALAGK